MNKTFLIRFEYSVELTNPGSPSTARLVAIKAARAALGIGLREAKELVEAGPVLIRVNPAQYGMLIALQVVNETYLRSSLKAIEDVPNLSHDLSDLAPL